MTSPARSGRWHPALRLLLAVVLAAGVVAGGSVLLARHPGFPAWAPSPVVLGIVAVVLFEGYVVERRRAAAIGLDPRRLRDLLPGVVGGITLIALTVAVLFALHAATVFRGRGTSARLAVVFVACVWTAVGEELIVRGLVLRLLEEWLGSTVAVLASAALFGVLHLGNEGATLGTSVAIAIEAGLLLGAAWVLTRSVWLGIGIHWGWNFAEGHLFGASVSGHDPADAYLRTIPHGPAWLNGGAFGPEGGLVAVLVCLGPALAFIALAAQKGRWRRTGLHRQTA